MEYITLEEIKEQLKIPQDNNEQDEIIKNMILLAKNMIDDAIGQNLEEKTYSEIIRNCSSDMIFLSRIPKSIIKIQTFEGDILPWISYNKNVVYLKKRYNKDIIVEYVSGYSEVPRDIKELAKNLVKNARKDFNSKEELAIRSKKIDTLSITYFSKKETEKGNPIKEQLGFNKIIKKYKNLFFIRTI